MGIEWRVFTESSEEDFQTQKVQSGTEHRIDIYLIFENYPQYGLKLRNEISPALELKIRTNVGKKGVEIWKKVISAQMKTHQVYSKQEELQINPAIVAEAEQILERGKTEYSADVQCCLNLLRAGDYRVVKLEKCRRQSWGLAYTSESTWIKWSLMNGASLHEGYVFSACCEGRKDLAKRAKRFRKLYQKKYTPEGYPQFCERLCATDFR